MYYEQSEPETCDPNQLDCPYDLQADAQWAVVTVNLIPHRNESRNNKRAT